jgi:hypothetical protein
MVRYACATLCLLLLGSPSQPGERCYLIIFGAQSHPKIIRHTHTWATFVRTIGTGDNPADWSFESVTISWLPASLNMHPLVPWGQVGVNLDLHGTLNMVMQNKESIAAWGPYEIAPGLYEKAALWAACLNAGVPRYKASNRFRRPHNLDCMHAVADVDRDRGRFHTRTAAGQIASYFLLHHFEPWVIDSGVTHDWVASRLGLECYPIERRQFCEKPFSLLPLRSPWYSEDGRNFGRID